MKALTVDWETRRLVVNEEPCPAVEHEDEVVLRVSYSGISPTDTHVVAGTYGRRTDGSSLRPGMDAAGTLVEVGGESPYPIGTSVMCFTQPLGPNGGAYVEFLKVPWTDLAPLEPGLELMQAATLPMNGLSALQCLDLAAVGAGDMLLVTGAPGFLGSLVTQLAVRQGVHVICDARSGEAAQMLRLGAAESFERGPEFIDTVRAAHPGGVDAVIDAAVHDAAVAPVLRRGGILVSTRFWTGDETTQRRGITVLPLRVRDEHKPAARLRQLGKLVADGELAVPIAGVFPYDQVQQAHDHLAQGGLNGRLVLAWPPTPSTEGAA